MIITSCFLLSSATMAESFLFPKKNNVSPKRVAQKVLGKRSSGKLNRTIVKFYKHKNSYLQIGYAFTTPHSDYSFAKDMHNIGIDYLFKRRAILHGVGIVGAFGTDSYNFELIYNGFVHFTKLFRAIPLVPYFGLQLGGGYHSFDGTTKFKKAAFNDTNINSYIVARVKVGFFYSINEDVTMGFTFENNFLQERALGGGVSLLLKL